jgi:hypothetical protein
MPPRAEAAPAAPAAPSATGDIPAKGPGPAVKRVRRVAAPPAGETKGE